MPEDAQQTVPAETTVTDSISAVVKAAPTCTACECAQV